MKKNQKKVKMKRVLNNFIKTCPRCGYSFRSIDPKTKKKIKVCSMCGYKFIEPDVFPKKPSENDFRFLK